MAVAARQMVIHHADGLHEGVTDGRTDESKAALLQVLAQGVGFRGAGRNLPGGP
jgi:hypothetical protein